MSASGVSVDRQRIWKEKTTLNDQEAEERDADLPNPRKNGAYSLISQGITNGHVSCSNLVVDDTDCGFWFLRGPVLQKWVS